jgi:hypothetical protein
MLRTRSVVAGSVFFIAGYAAGTMTWTSPVPLQAQQEDDGTQYSGDVLEAYRKAHKSVREVTNLFVAGGQSTSASGGLNFFGASVGGIDAEKDLEEGRGVDPETFAGLYADMATPKIAEHLDYDELGRLRYKKNVIRIYSRERLKQLFQKRDQLEIQSEDSE